MPTSERLAKQIEAAEAEIKEKGIEIQKLRQQHKTQVGKERSERLSKRAGHIEIILPETISLTDEQFFQFVEKTILTDFARKILIKFKEQNTAEQAAQQSESAETTGETGD